MPVEVILPKLTTTMDEGTIARWLKQEGDSVQSGQPLFELETDKVMMTVESPASGTLSRILFPAGSTIPIGGVVAWVATEKEDVVNRAERKEIAAHPAERRAKVSPLARQLAQEYGIDLSVLEGSGPEGRIIEPDVRAAIEKRTSTTATAPQAKSIEADQRVVPISNVRRVIAERMANSARAVARVTLTTEADATRLVDWRSRIKDQQLMDPAPTYTDLIVFLVARALREHPYLNARFDGEAIRLLEPINVGIAVDTERGLLAPVLRDADQKDVAAIARETAQLIEKTRTGQAAPDDLSGGTFTITNLGMYDIDAFTPIINLPECAILGLGRIAPKPVVYKSEIVARQRIALSLSFDHRLVDGAPAARFLQCVKDLIEEPLLLLGGIMNERPAVRAGAETTGAICRLA